MGQVRIILAMLQLLGTMRDQVRMVVHRNTDSQELVPDFLVVAVTTRGMDLKIIEALATINNRVDTVNKMVTANKMGLLSRMVMQANKVVTGSKMAMVSRMGTASRMVMLNRTGALDSARMAIKALAAIRARDSTTEPRIIILPRHQLPVLTRGCILCPLPSCCPTQQMQICKAF